MQQKKTNNRIRSFDGVVRRTRVEKISAPVTGTFVSKYMLRSGLKMAGVAVLILTLSFGLSKIGSTVSYFNDTEESIGNRLQAGILGFTLSSGSGVLRKTSDFSLLAGVDASIAVPESIGTKQFGITVEENDGSLPAVYTVRGELDQNSSLGCGEMSVDVTFGDFHFVGLLKDLLSPKIFILGEWHFLVSLPTVNHALAPKAECSGRIVFSAGLAGVKDELSGTFSDVQSYAFDLYNWESATPLPTEEIVEPEPKQEPVSETPTVVGAEEVSPEVLEEVIPLFIEDVPAEVPPESLVLPELEISPTAEL